MKKKPISKINKDIVTRDMEKLERISYLETSITFTDVRFQDPGLIYISLPYCIPNPLESTKLKIHLEWLFQ